MAEIRVNGVRLYYEEHGQGDPILCIHGTSSSAMAWAAAVDELSRLGRVLLYDRRGCTRSERPDPFETSVGQQAEDAAALLQALGVTPAVVIGRSYGGEVATELALRHPDRVRALVLLDGAPPALDAEARAWTEDVRAAVEEAAARDMSTVAETLFDRMLGEGQWESFPEPLRQMFGENAPAILAELRGSWQEATATELARIDVPTLLMAPAEPLPGMNRATERMAAALPNSRTVVVAGGHLIDAREAEVMRFVAEILRR